MKKYLKQINTLSSSGVGVMLTRTREPFRAIESLREFAFSKGLPFGIWNIRDGWTKYTSEEFESGTIVNGDGVADVYKALKKIMDIDGGGKEFWEAGVFVMNAVHPWLAKHPGFVECLRHYARDFAESTALRLVLIVPECQNLPEELQHDIPVVDYDLPNREEIAEIYDYVIESSTPEGEEVPVMYEDSLKDTIVGSASGMTQMEAEVAMSKAIVENRPPKDSKKKWHEIEFTDFNGTILDSKTDVVKQSEVLELMKGVSMEDVGGLEVFKEWIKTASECMTPEAYSAGVDKSKGIVAVGPPGTGKTLLGKATGTVLNRPLVRVDVSKCFAGIVGSSESKARSAIKQLESMSPCVALIDEVDKALGGAHKGGGDSGVSQRVLGIFLTAMQESEADIFWILTANRVEGLPSEMLRKGRMDEVFAVLPPNEVERKAVLDIHLKKRNEDPKEVSDLYLAVTASKGFVSAEIEAAVKEAKKVSFRSGESITGKSLVAQLEIMKPLSEAFPEDFKSMENWAKNNARNASRADGGLSASPKIARKRTKGRRAVN